MLLTLTFGLNLTHTVHSQSLHFYGLSLGGGLTFKAQNIHIFHEHSDDWRWDHHAVSKFQEPITQWCGPTSQDNRDLNCTTQKAQNLTTYTVIILPYNYWLPIAVRIVTNKVHSADCPHTWHSSSRTWQMTVAGHNKDKEGGNQI